jgi:predicted MFS family arabinose efflux permease
MIAAVGMGSGGLMGGVMYNMFGSYAVPFLTSTGTGMISALLALTLPSTKKPEQEVTTPQVVLQTS